MNISNLKVIEKTAQYVHELIREMEKEGELTTAIKMLGDMAFRVWIDTGKVITAEEIKANGNKDADDNF